MSAVEEPVETPEQPPADTLETVTARRFESLSDEQILRLFIFEQYANSEIDGNIMVENMEAAYRWVIDHKMPRKKPQIVKDETS